MHTIKLLLTYYMNISVQAANLLDCRIESNRIETFFCPNWNAILARPWIVAEAASRKPVTF